jgi:hypothetical protein
MPVASTQPRWKSSSAVAGVPITATRTATPIAAPICRATPVMAVAVAKRSPGASATATLLIAGNEMPAPMPATMVAGNQPPKKSGSVPASSR